MFVDSVAWIALFNASDALHQEARAAYGALQAQRVSLVTTSFVLLEVADALCASAIRAKTVASLDAVRLRISEIVPASEELLQKAWSLYSQRSDKDWD